MPSADYLEKVLKQFNSINPAWLLMGDGESFKDGATTAQNQTNILGDRNIVASGKNGKAIQKNYGLPECEKEKDFLIFSTRQGPARNRATHWPAPDQGAAFVARIPGGLLQQQRERQAKAALTGEGVVRSQERQLLRAGQLQVHLQEL
jgi:hypothetical protein